MNTDAPTKTSDAPNIARSRWRVDPARSRIEFRTPTLWGAAMVRGHFERYEGTLDLERTPAIELTLETDSLNTNMGFRDRHLRSAEFFDAENHPQVRFVSDSATVLGERLHVHGRLYAAGSSLPLELDAGVRRVGEELELDARTRADHRKLGMSHGTLGMIPTPSELIVHARLVADAN